MEPAPVALDLAHEPPLEQAARAQLLKQVEDRSEDVLRCYREALAYAPKMQGRMVLRLSIGAQGGIEQLRVVEDTTKFAAFDCCVAAIVSQFTWPPSASGSARTLDYPLSFVLVDMRWLKRNMYEGEWYHASVKPEGFTLHLDGMMYGDP